MGNLQLVDTFPDILAYWAQAEHQQMSTQIEAWTERYMHHWPELRGYKQTGYELVTRLYQQRDLHEIALLPDAESWQRPLLIELADYHHDLPIKRFLSVLCFIFPSYQLIGDKS